MPRNDLNDLTGKEWIKFTRTWFVCDSPRYWRNRETELHPARYPEEMAAEFISFFTKRGGWVLDPFAGSGATLVACGETGRVGVGIELSARYARVAAGRIRDLFGSQIVIPGDAREIGRAGFWRKVNELQAGGTPALPAQGGFPQFDFAITSPPYWQMLRTSRGGVFSKHRQRAAQGLDTAYSDHPDDLGNITDYAEFINALGKVFDGVAKCVKPGKYLVVVAQNFRDPEGEVRPLAWDLARRIGKTRWQFQGERIWCQNTKPLGIWGYPKVFVPNYHHHYCLIFRNRRVEESRSRGVETVRGRRVEGS
jgi:DNA modification methylase